MEQPLFKHFIESTDHHTNIDLLSELSRSKQESLQTALSQIAQKGAESIDYDELTTELIGTKHTQPIREKVILLLQNMVLLHNTLKAESNIHRTDLELIDYAKTVIIQDLTVCMIDEL